MKDTEKRLEEIKESLGKEMLVTLPDYDWQLIATKIHQAEQEMLERENTLPEHSEKNIECIQCASIMGRLCEYCSGSSQGTESKCTIKKLI